MFQCLALSIDRNIDVHACHAHKSQIQNSVCSKLYAEKVTYCTWACVHLAHCEQRNFYLVDQKAHGSIDINNIDIQGPSEEVS